jgi:hypothetical protein
MMADTVISSSLPTRQLGRRDDARYQVKAARLLGVGVTFRRVVTCCLAEIAARLYQPKVRPEENGPPKHVKLQANKLPFNPLLESSSKQASRQVCPKLADAASCTNQYKRARAECRNGGKTGHDSYGKRKSGVKIAVRGWPGWFGTHSESLARVAERLPTCAHSSLTRLASGETRLPSIWPSRNF